MAHLRIGIRAHVAHLRITQFCSTLAHYATLKIITGIMPMKIIHEHVARQHAALNRAVLLIV